jgi:hypothetical protein
VKTSTDYPSTAHLHGTLNSTPQHFTRERRAVDGSGGQTFSPRELKGELGVKVLHREFEQFGGAYTLREPSERYASALASESDTLRVENTLFWNEKAKLCRHSVV